MEASKKDNTKDSKAAHHLIYLKMRMTNIFLNDHPVKLTFILRLRIISFEEWTREIIAQGQEIRSLIFFHVKLKIKLKTSPFERKRESKAAILTKEGVKNTFWKVKK